LGPFDREEFDRLVWEERKLVEVDAYIHPVEDLPPLVARMRRRREDSVRERRIAAFLKESSAMRRYVLRELELRGPLLSREIEDHSTTRREAHRWYGERKMALMLMILADRGEVAVAGRRQGQRLWDLAERWYPVCERVSWHDRKTGRLHVRGVWWEPGARPVSLDRPLRRLARWLRATIA